MNKSELRHLAIRHLNTKKIQSNKKGFARHFTDKRKGGILKLDLIRIYKIVYFCSSKSYVEVESDYLF